MFGYEADTPRRIVQPKRLFKRDFSEKLSFIANRDETSQKLVSARQRTRLTSDRSASSRGHQRFSFSRSGISDSILYLTLPQIVVIRGSLMG